MAFLGGACYDTTQENKKSKGGNLYIGGDAPITIQSMTNTKTSDVEATVNQIKALEEAGDMKSGCAGYGSCQGHR